MRKLALLVGLFMLLVGGATKATPQFDIGSGGGSRTSIPDNYTFGFEFNLSSAVLVDGLGFWDDFLPSVSGGSAGSGLNQSGGYQVGLWNSSSVLLASTTITNSSTVVPSAFSGGQWLFNFFATPTSLAPGNYRLGALSTEHHVDNVLYQGSGPPTGAANAAFTFVGSREVFGSVLADPTNSFILPWAAFGPNLSTTPIPEPTTALLLTLGLTGLGMRRRVRNN